MASNLKPLAIRQGLGRLNWGKPTAFGPDGWLFIHNDGRTVIVTCTPFEGHEWVHASITRPSETPTYEDLKLLHKAVFGDGWAYQVFAPTVEHVNIHPFALHLWGLLDGKPVIPNFTNGLGTI